MIPPSTTTSPRPRCRPWMLAAGTACAVGIAMAIAWFPAAAHHVASQAEPISLLGHASYALAALSFAQTRMLRLRLLAVASFVLGLLYNGLIHIQMPEGQNLWPTLIWLSAFLAQNVYQVRVHLRRQRESSLVLAGEVALIHPAATPRPQ